MKKVIRPKKLWGACVNMSGLFCDKPIELTYNDEYECWLSDMINTNIDFDVKGPGLTVNWGHISFASKNKKEVECFLLGAKSVCERLYSFIEYGRLNVKTEEKEE